VTSASAPTQATTRTRPVFTRATVLLRAVL
jgi:hypothetical protein